VGAILRHRILAPLVLGVVLLVVQVALIRFVPPAGVFFYYVTVGILELLEAAVSALSPIHQMAGRFRPTWGLPSQQLDGS
jgi:uncharacterized membrane protein YozB (DUF420 family)